MDKEKNLCTSAKPYERPHWGIHYTTARREYELALRIGNKRFGSECRHEQTKDGHCTSCLRKVI